MRKVLGKSLASVAVVALAVAPASARNAAELSDLVGVLGGAGESALQSRGYTYMDGHKGSSYIHSYYWHSRDKNCVEVKTANGEYQKIVDAPASDCNQRESSGGVSTGAAVAGVAVAGLLVAAISHKSSHHDDEKHLADQQHEEQYERGYNDGLYAASYHNYDRSDYYADGYEAGVAQRERNLSDHSRRGGYARHVSLKGIQGQDSVWAFDEMRSRGFTNVDAFSSGNTNYGIYWNGSTGQCVQVTNARSRVEDIRDIGQHPNCR